MDSPTASVEQFSVAAIRGSDTGYVAFHAPRFARVLRVLENLGVSSQTRVLDIGRSKLTALIRSRFGVAVDTLGFPPDEMGSGEKHFHFDLNRSQHESQWRRDIPEYDVVVMAEVIEHLYTAPELVLAFLKTIVAPGGTLLIQTPNAAAGTKRIKLLLGRNPYEMIRLDNTNPGHFREYTVAELRRLANDAGFEVRRCEVQYYFDARYAHHGANPRYDPVVGTLKNLVFPLLPPSLRLGITMTLTRR